MSEKMPGRFIWCAEAGVNQYVDFTQEFTAQAGPARLLAGADSEYAVWLNGEFVGAGQFSDYPGTKTIDEYDVALKDGVNIIFLRAYYQGADSSMYRKGTAGVAFAITVGEKNLCASGPETRCGVSPAYVSGDMERITGQLSFVARYVSGGDILAGKGDDSYMSPATVCQEQPHFRERPVERLVIGGEKPAALCAQGVFRWADSPRTIGDAAQRAWLSSRSRAAMNLKRIELPDREGITLEADTDADGVYLVVDLGEEETGYLSLDLETDGPCRVLAAFGEHLDDLRVRAHVGGRNFTLGAEHSGSRMEWTHWLRRLGMRYVQLFVAAPKVTVHYVGLRPCRYPVSHVPYFASADGMHNEIFEICRRTLELCMHEHYEDCPWREQALYTMDSRNQMLCGYYVFGEQRFARTSLTLLGKGLREDGLMELCAPARVPLTIPSFALIYPVQVEEYVRYTADESLAREVWHTLRVVLDTFIHKRDKNGLVPAFKGKGYWNFYEWRDSFLDGGGTSHIENEQRYDAPLNGYFALALRAAARLAERMGEAGDAQKWRAVYHELAQSVQAFFDPVRGVYASWIDAGGARSEHACELANSLMVCAEVCPREHLDGVLEALVPGSNKLIPVTLSYTIFKYDALLAAGNKYARAVFDDVAGVWGRMLRMGATSFWETEEGPWDFDEAGSLCHGWSAVPAYLYFRYLLGVVPTGDGSWARTEPLDGGVLKPRGRIMDFSGKVTEV